MCIEINMYYVLSCSTDKIYFVSWLNFFTFLTSLHLRIISNMKIMRGIKSLMQYYKFDLLNFTFFLTLLTIHLFHFLTQRCKSFFISVLMFAYVYNAGPLSSMWVTGDLKVQASAVYHHSQHPDTHTKIQRWIKYSDSLHDKNTNTTL